MLFRLFIFSAALTFSSCYSGELVHQRNNSDGGVEKRDLSKSTMDMKEMGKDSGEGIDVNSHDLKTSDMGSTSRDTREDMKPKEDMEMDADLGSEKVNLDPDALREYDIKRDTYQSVGELKKHILDNGKSLFIVNNGAAMVTQIPTAMNGKDHFRAYTKRPLGMTTSQRYAVRLKMKTTLESGSISVKKHSVGDTFSVRAKFSLSEFPGVYSGLATACIGEGSTIKIHFATKKANDELPANLAGSRCEVDAGKIYYLNVETNRKGCKTTKDYCNVFFELSGVERHNYP